MARYCRYCGKEISENAVFCSGCGNAVPRQEKPKMEAAQPKFCRNCGNELGPGAKFCKACGCQVGAPIHNGNIVTAGTAQRNKKKTSAGNKGFLKPVIAAVLVVAIFVSFIYPGFVRKGLSGSNGNNTTVTMHPEGDSKPFKTETPYGITISAEADALDKDREFKLEPVSAKQLDTIDKLIPEVTGSMGSVLDAWELDAGLADDEILPGHYTMDISLKKLGLEESDYDSLKFYRIDEEGKWYEYGTSRNGDTVMIEARQNSILAAVLIGIALSPFGYDASLALSSGAYFNPKTNEYDLEYNGKAVMSVMVDVKAILPSLTSGNEQLFRDIVDKAKDIVAKQVGEEENLKGRNYKDVQSELNELKRNPEKAEYATKKKKEMDQRGITLAREMAKNDPVYQKIENEFEEIKKNPQDPKVRPKLHAIDMVCENATRAWGWLESQGLNMPDYKFRIELSGEDKGAYGTTNSPLTGNPYMVISMPKAAKADAYTNDNLLCTICHELFHAVQRTYVSKRFASDKFDEMTAQDVEWMAYDHFSSVKDKPITTSKEELLGNLEDVYNFAIPLNTNLFSPLELESAGRVLENSDNVSVDDFSANYPEGKLSPKSDSESAYPIAPFVRYLRGQKGVNYPMILTKYHGLFGIRSVTTILKESFGINTDESLTEYYQAFAEDYKNEFLKEAKKSSVNEIFAPPAKLEQKSGKTKIDLMNKDYTVRVRRVSLDADFDSLNEYAVALKMNDEFKERMPDFKITPLDMEKDTEYQEYEGMLFFEPKAWSEEDVLYLMEVDGGSGINSGPDVCSDYTLYLMEKPEAPGVEVQGEKILVKLPPFSERPSSELVDSYVITIRSGKTIVAQERMGRKSISEPVEFEIKDLEIKGKKLNDDEKKNLEVVISECIKGTFEEGDPCEGCFGPESDPVAIFDDIYGTWEIQSSMQDYGSSLFDQYVGSLGGLADSLGDLGEGLSQYVEGYNSIEEQYASAVTKGTMIIRPSDQEGMVEADMEFEGAPKQTYIGRYDKNTMKLRLDLKDTMYTDSDGNTYDLRDFGMATGMELEFSTNINPRDPDTTVMTFYGESSMDNALVTYKTILTGTKLSDRY
ncbi:MAG: zinc-ribbon domain-containing protein [Lachnospiraceae bacterium]|nr:zinc-ribbon domain-containing protein [Lachnospiraceae bacterium]